MKTKGKKTILLVVCQGNFDEFVVSTKVLWKGLKPSLQAFKIGVVDY
ncbi:hypothetical protein SAMD00079811_39120 [Scytonema sp. HK-05]|nr:hypothetical protein SAMD00079811_39120 [Scytonema sp. HK-05]